MTGEPHRPVPWPARAVSTVAAEAAYRVRFDEAGPDGLARPSTLLRYAQDVAWIHSESLGFDRAWYASRGLAWVVRSAELVTNGPIRTGDVVVVPVLRAGLGMLDAVLRLIPWARVGHIGLRRDETTAVASRYYSRLPHNMESSYVLMVDPMLATGGSAIAVLRRLRQAGATDLRLVCLVAAPEGVRAVREAEPDVPILAGTLDRQLDERGYIRPGLGDAGDRIFGTE